MENNQLKELLEKFDHWEDRLSRLDEIYYYLVGNKLDPSTGMINRIKNIDMNLTKIDERIKALEDFKKKAIWIGVGMALPTTYGVFELLSKFLKAL